MGKRGPLPKPGERVQGHRKRAAGLAVVARTDLIVPEPPAGLSGAALEAWAAFWRSEVAAVTAEVDWPVVRRLFSMYAAQERALEASERMLVVAGSKGQLRLNPLADYALKLEAAIVRLENELGLTPASRARLGIAVGQARLTLEELNRRAREGVESGGADPRLALVDDASS